MPTSSAKAWAQVRCAQDALQLGAARLRGVTDRPHLEAEILLAHLLERPRVALLAHPKILLAPEIVARYADYVRRRMTGEPLPYIVERADFFGMRFQLSPDVLIPRPETELLVEEALRWLKQHPARLAVDVGTGSGCIAVALAAHVPDIHLCAIDISPAALAVARANAARHKVAERITFIAGDLLTPLSGSVPLVMSNPPYVSAREWADLPVSVQQEPCTALLAGHDGLDVLRRLLHQARGLLSRPSLMLVEIGQRQGQAAQRLARQAFPRAEVDVLPDLAGKDRLLRVLFL